MPIPQQQLLEALRRRTSRRESLRWMDTLLYVVCGAVVLAMIGAVIYLTVVTGSPQRLIPNENCARSGCQ